LQEKQSEHAVDLTDKSKLESDAIHIAALATAGVSAETAKRFLVWVEKELEKNRIRRDRRYQKQAKRELREAGGAAPTTTASAAATSASSSASSSSSAAAPAPASAPASAAAPASSAAAAPAAADADSKAAGAEGDEAMDRSKTIAEPFLFDVCAFLALGSPFPLRLR
jgi:hypothetical protein